MFYVFTAEFRPTENWVKKERKYGEEGPDSGLGTPCVHAPGTKPLYVHCTRMEGHYGLHAMDAEYPLSQVGCVWDDARSTDHLPLTPKMKRLLQDYRPGESARAFYGHLEALRDAQEENEDDDDNEDADGEFEDGPILGEVKRGPVQFGPTVPQAYGQLCYAFGLDPDSVVTLHAERGVITVETLTVYKFPTEKE